jgi:hypothetical protein
MKELILLFLRQVLENIPSRATQEDEPVLKAVVTTPLGKLESIRPSQLELLRMPYISETGKVGRVPMERLYLEQTFNNLATELGIDSSELFDGSRELVIVADVDTSSDSKCIPCYYGTTANPVNMANLQRLEANVMRCLDESLDYLPADILYKWKNSVLIPVFEQARTVISGKDTEQA